MAILAWKQVEVLRNQKKRKNTSLDIKNYYFKTPLILLKNFAEYWSHTQIV